MEFIGLLIFISAFFCNALYHAYNDMFLSGRWDRKKQLYWIKEREHVFKTFSLIMMIYAVKIGQPTWCNLTGWVLLGYGFTWNAVYYHFKLGFFLDNDGVFIPTFGLKDNKIELSPIWWALLMLVGFLVGGATLSLI